MDSKKQSKSLRKLTTDEVKDIEFGILCRFANYCDENQLRYYLCGGTLLGAIRHQGFIPWDDDIDVLMPRPDYIRFLELNSCAQVLPMGTIWNHTANIPYIKLFDTSTFIKQKYNKCLGMEHLWIDVFPMDGLPSSSLSLNISYKISRFFRKMLTLSESNFATGTTLCKRIGKILVYAPAKLIGARRWARWIDSYSQRNCFENCNYIGGIAWGYGPQELMKKSEYLPYEEVIFENHKFHAPLCWHQYLSNLYGNYMELPPKEQRLNHSTTAWKEI